MVTRTTAPAPASLHAVSKSRDLAHKIVRLNPEVVFLHVGQVDALSKSAGNNVVEELNNLIKNILTNTKTKLCVSLIIPVLGLPQKASVIRQINREVAAIVSELRKSEENKTRIFTSNNDALSGYVTGSVNKHGFAISLNDRGQRKLWLLLKDGLSRALQLAPQYRTIYEDKNLSSQRNRRNDE